MLLVVIRSHFFVVTSFIIIYLTRNTSGFEQCKVIVPETADVCLITSINQTNCNITNSATCSKDFNVSVIQLEPFNTILQGYFTLLVGFCCNGCYNISYESTYNNTNEFITTLNRNGDSSDFIYPALGKTDSTIVKGYYFLPTVDITSYTIVTLKRSKTEVLTDLMVSSAELWPLIVICLLLALIAGFLIWILDTWSNKVEFPRPFLKGLSEGFWWAFISMTTVGYGDRTPKSVVARIFGVLWILIGITIFSMVTASLTAILSESNALPSTDVSGKKVAVYDNRMLDASIAAEKGAVVTRFSEFSLIDQKLEDGDIDAFIIDFISSTNERRNNPSVNDRYIFQTVEYKSDHSYGILIKKQEDYEFFKHFAEDNNLIYKTCSLQAINSLIEKDEEVESIFNPPSDLFWSSLITTGAVIGFILLCGGVYELVRWKNKTKEDYALKKVEENEYTNKPMEATTENL